MTDAAASSATPQDASTAPAQIAVLAQYIRDLSFENPNAPNSLAIAAEQPAVAINVDVRARRLAELRYEVSLKLKAEAKHKDAVAFVAELEYCGLFAFKNMPPERIETACLIECPRLLFPFARRIFADASRDGGFPPLYLEPIDFEELWRRSRQKPADTAKAGPPAAASSA
jgi:preprotein translocase subunit SecB